MSELMFTLPKCCRVYIENGRGLVQAGWPSSYRKSLPSELFKGYMFIVTSLKLRQNTTHYDQLNHCEAQTSRVCNACRMKIVPRQALGKHCQSKNVIVLFARTLNLPDKQV